MPRPLPIKLYLSALTAALLTASSPWATGETAKAAKEPFSLVVMDPLAAPLSCPCVAGYAQRKYEVLAAHLEQAIGRPVTLTFAESLEKALKKEGCTTAHLIIGKDSVVRADADKAGFQVRPLAQLSGLDGMTTQTGLIVVPSNDPAQSVADLKGYRVIFGPSDCSEKSSAARVMLEAAGVDVPPPDKVEISAACSDGACKIIEWGEGVRGAAVISSYAAPLLEGCGTIKKGDLRIVAETEPVPFITAFVTDKVEKSERKLVRELLLDSGAEPELLTALESMMGFVPLEDDYPHQVSAPRRDSTDETAGAAADAADETETSAAQSTDEAHDESASAWPGWRGPQRDGHCAWLPNVLPAQPRILWRQPLDRSGLAGIAATHEFVIIGDRDAGNSMDVWRGYDAATGEELWTVEYAAPGKLDYDNVPRATPQIDGEFVYTCGAFGDLRCIDLATGVVLWQTNIRQQFGAEDELIWGSCASPLLVDEKVIVNPGAPQASFVALDAYTGKTVWESPGDIHAFASPIVATLGGVRQIIGLDRSTLFGCDVATGRRLWTLKPPYEGDFNVPTPVVAGDKLLVVSENNGARLHAFDDRGVIIAAPVAVNANLRPDMSTPVAVAGRVYCVWDKLYCLDAATLEKKWIGEDDAFADYAPVIACDERLLILGRGGELLLVDAATDSFRIVSRLQLFDDPLEREANPFAHPAIVGTRLYVRGERQLICVDLGAKPDDAGDRN